MISEGTAINDSDCLIAFCEHTIAIGVMHAGGQFSESVEIGDDSAAGQKFALCSFPHAVIEATIYNAWFRINGVSYGCIRSGICVCGGNCCAMDRCGKQHQ